MSDRDIEEAMRIIGALILGLAAVLASGFAVLLVYLWATGRL